jgi:hypothetical protein
MSYNDRRRVWTPLALAGALLTWAPAYSATLVVGPDFSVAVTLSAKAAARLANPRETVLVTASFYGMPKSEKLREEYQGEFPLAPQEEVEISGAGAAHFSGPRYDKGKLSLVEGGVLKLGLLVVSGRHSSPDNFLWCTPFEASLASVASKPIAIECKLISEQF